jgi:hypothetical protein
MQGYGLRQLFSSLLKEFNLGQQSGRWGELVAFKGPKVYTAKLLPKGSIPVGPGLAGIAAAMVRSVVPMMSPTKSNSYLIPVNNGVMELFVAGGPVEGSKRFTSLERFRTNNGKSYYVQLRPQTTPYTITYEPRNSAVKTLRPDHDGRCFRVHGGQTKPEKGILIHEAPSVGWVTGCISPRPLNDFTIDHPNRKGNPSYRAMEELFSFVGKRADLFVLDW